MTWRAGLSPYNWIDYGSTLLTPSAQALTAPATNVQTYEAGVPWIAPNLSLTSGTVSLVAVFDRLRPVSCFGFLAAERIDDSLDVDFEPHLAPADTVRWRLFANADGSGTPVVDSRVAGVDIACGVDLTKGVHGWRAPWTGGAEPQGRRVEFTFRRLSVPAPPKDIARFGRIWAGPFREFETNHDWGSEIGWDDDALEHRVRVWGGEFRWIPERAAAGAASLAYLETVAQQCGSTRQVFFWPRSDRAADAFMARFPRAAQRFRRRMISNLSDNEPGLVAAWAPALQEDWLGV